MTNEFVSGMPGPSVKREKTFEEVIANSYRILAEKQRKRLKKQGVKEFTMADEDIAAQDWYEKYQAEQDRWSAKEVAKLRRDDDLPSDDDLPF